MTAPMTSREELEFLEENIATVAFHLGQPGARLGISHDGGALAVDPGEVLAEISRRLSLAQSANNRGLDNDRQVFFYEQDFYVLSNFSSFGIEWGGNYFPTSEHAYHHEKFVFTGMMRGSIAEIRRKIRTATSAHVAFKLAEQHKSSRRPDWMAVRVGIMRRILRAKAEQHGYVLRKLLATGDRELIENSWRDDFWGWGPNRDGQNMLGKLWMEVRADLRKTAMTSAD